MKIMKAQNCVEDNKEGILTSYVSRGLSKRGLLSIECPLGAVKGKSIIDRSCRRKLATNFFSILIPSNEEVISILDHDIHLSKGVKGAFKMPIVHKDPSGTILAELPLSNQTKSYVASEMSDYDDLIVGLQAKNPSSNNIFSPKWNLTNESCISSREVAMEIFLPRLP